MINNDFKFQELIKQELFEAELKYPDYHSFHEGYAVLKEEIEELQEEFNCIQSNLIEYWQNIRSNKVVISDIKIMESNIINILKEAIQIGSILKRHKKLFGEKI